MRTFTSLAIVALVLLALPISYADESIVNTLNGPVKGSVSATTRSFKGIPYAAPPVGSLRFQPTQTAASWSGTLQATEFAAGCPQDCELPPFTCPNVTSEDCLYLNIYTPRLSAMKEKLPVMVFFHGGNFIQGSAGTLLYDGENFAPEGNVVLVTVSYRLGVLGFLYDGISSKGNFGLLDQQMALRWVQDNIGNFGGDANRVTIFGQSAGGMSIACHLVAPDSDKLFHKAIIQSNPLAIPMKSRSIATDYAKYFYYYLGCSMGDLNCAKAKTASQIIEAQVLTGKKINILHPMEIFVPFTPVHYPHGPIPLQPSKAMELGYFKKVPMMFGSVLQDGLLFIYKASPEMVTDAGYIAIISAIFGEDAATVLLKYPPAPIVGDKRPLLSTIATDYVFGCSNRYFMEHILQESSEPLYLYIFNHSLSWKGWGPLYPFCEGKVCHGAELPFLFNPPLSEAGVKFTPDEVKLSKTMIGYWSNFAATSNPNGPNLPNWPSFSSTGPSPRARIDLMAPTSVSVTDYQAAVCNFWDSIGYEHGW